MTDRQTANLLLEALFQSSALGLCLCDADARVVSIEGGASLWAPQVGQRLDESFVFIGMFDDILSVRTTGRTLTIPGISISDTRGVVDIDVLWLDQVQRFAVLSKSAEERVQMQGAAAQFVRDNRLLEERIREQQAKITEQAEMMRLFVRHVPAAVAMLDQNLDVLMASERWKQEHGDPALAASGHETASPLTWPKVRNELRLALDGGVQTTRMERSTLRGRQTWKRLVQAPWRNAHHEVGGTILFCEDVTDAMRKAENLRARVEDLHKLGEEMDKLGHAVTNDLRAPMRQIDFFSRFLLDDQNLQLDETSEGYLQQIRGCVERIDRMMAALQRYLRLSERDITNLPFEIGDAVSIAVQDLRDEVDKAHVFVTMRESVGLNGDVTLISGMFRRLIDNAIKYAGEGSTLLIECFLEGEDVLIRFTDDGPGIAPHLRRRAFDFFERLNAPVTVPGEGMGLAECRKIVDLHGGAMTLDPDFDGGVRVLISLPRRARRGADFRLSQFTPNPN